MTGDPSASSKVVAVTLLTQPDCALCDHAKAVLVRLAAERLVTVREIDLSGSEGRALAVRHGVLFAPGVLLDGHPFSFGRLSEKRLRRQVARIANSDRA